MLHKRLWRKAPALIGSRQILIVDLLPERQRLDVRFHRSKVLVRHR